MTDYNNSTGKRTLKGKLTYVVIVSAVLALLVGGIELVRRARGPAQTTSPTLLAGDAAAQPFPRELRDASGETLIIREPPRRIVSQTLGTDEILLAICRPEHVVALSSLAGDENYSNVVEQARRIPGRATQGAEQIIQLQPDLIFVASYSRAETVEMLKASRAPVFRFANFDTIADIKSNIRAVGYATGCDQEAEKLINQMETDLASLRARAPQGERPVRAMSFGREGYTAGAGTLFDDLVRAAGAVNVSAEQGVKGFGKISVEKIAEWQPDVIIAGAHRGEIENVRQQLLADPVIAASRAGQTQRILVMDNRHFLTVSQYAVRAVEDLANAFYGNRR